MVNPWLNPDSQRRNAAGVDGRNAPVQPHPLEAKFSVMTRVVGLLLALPLILDGCASSSPTLYQGNSEYPKFNPQSQHYIRLTGTISPSLSLSMIASYSTSSQNRHCLSTHDFRPLQGKDVEIPLNIKQENGKFTAEALVDKFLPGDCKWSFTGVGAILRKGGISSAENGPLFYSAENSAGNVPETGWSNSPSEHVTWGCRSLRGSLNILECSARNGQKETHRASSTTTEVSMDFLDLD